MSELNDSVIYNDSLPCEYIFWNIHKMNPYDIPDDTGNENNKRTFFHQRSYLYEMFLVKKCNKSPRLAYESVRLQEKINIQVPNDSNRSRRIITGKATEKDFELAMNAFKPEDVLRQKQLAFAALPISFKMKYYMEELEGYAKYILNTPRRLYNTYVPIKKDI